MFLLYPWLRLFKCCRCLTLDDREGEEATIRKMKKKREKKKREEADKHREFQRRLEEKKRKEEEEWLERSGLNDFLEDDDKGDIFDTDFNNGKSKKDGIDEFEEYFDKKIYEAEDEFDRKIAELAAQGKDNIVRKNIKGLRINTNNNAVKSNSVNRPQMSMSHRNLERIRNEYISDQTRKKDMEADIKERQKRKALNARRRKKMEAQLLKNKRKSTKIDIVIDNNGEEESVINDVHNEFRQNTKRRQQEAELIKNKQLEHTKKKIKQRKNRNIKMREEEDESNFEFI